jgi:hypothetical protein
VPVIEVTTFRLRAGVEETDFFTLDKAVQEEFIAAHPGFLRRTTARGNDGRWLVVTLWTGETEADHSATLAVDDPVVGAFMAALDPTSVESARYRTLDP